MKETETVETNAAQGMASNSSQFLTFSLAGEEYGVDILKVQEIKGYVRTTRIPNTPPEVVGVLNLRGTIVPIVDLRRKFQLDAIEYDAFTAIVVVVLDQKVVGMIVDRVSEVMSIPASDIQPPADYGATATENMIAGMGKVNEKLIILLNIDAVLNGLNDQAAGAAA